MADNNAPARELGFATKSLHAGHTPDSASRARAVPIYQTHFLHFRELRPRRGAVRSAAVRQHLLPHHESRPPTSSSSAWRRSKAASAGLATSSGQAAQFLAITSLLGPGDEMVAASTLYGGTYTQFDVSFRRLGIDVKFVEPDDPENFRKAITPKTRAALRRDHRQSAHERTGHRGGRQDRARGRRAAGDRQHHGVAVPVPADRARRGHRRPLGHQVPGRPRHVDRRHHRR